MTNSYIRPIHYSDELQLKCSSHGLGALLIKLRLTYYKQHCKMHITWMTNGKIVYQVLYR